MEYISKDKTLKKLQMQLLDLEADQDKGEYSELCENRGARDALDGAIYDIRTLKPADVQPVKRGQWIISNIYAKCSECSVAYDLDTFQRLIPMNENVPRHCSYCGAKMIRDGDTNGT